MRALVFVEHSGGVVSESALEMSALARAAGADVNGLICVGDFAAAEALVAQLAGFDAVVAIVDPAVAQYNPAATLLALKAVIDGLNPDLVMTSYSTAGIDLAPAVAVLTGRDMLAYVTALEANGDALAATSQVYGGKLIAQTALALPAIISVMPGACKADAVSRVAPKLTLLDVNLSNARTRVRQLIAPDTSGVNLVDATRIFCVGRALGGSEKLPIAQELANALNAELAGSRPVIDASWLPKVRQVGKSGTKVKPKLYLMAGVSGAPEHLEGMADSELIIAINSDEKAPIFRKAHYGAVCDMFQLMPKLTERLNAGKS